MSKRLLFILLPICLVLCLGLTPCMAEEPEKDLQKEEQVEAKKGDAKVADATKDVKVTPKKKPEKKKEAPKPAVQDHSKEKKSVTRNEVGDITIYNYGINATFINSNVTVNGGEISAEMEKTIGEPSEAVEDEDKTQAKKPQQGRPNGGRPGTPPSEKPGKFEQTIKDATKTEGLFTIYTKEDRKVLWEVLPAQLDKQFLISGVLATGVGSSWAKPGTYLGDTIVYFRNINGKIQIVERNLRFTASEDSPREKAVKKNYSDSIMASLPVAATNPENAAYLVDMTQVFMSDYFQVGRMVGSALRGGYGVDGSNSYIKETKNNPENVVVFIEYALRGGSLGGNIAVPDGRSATVNVITDIRQLKDNPEFEPRIADNRVGHFIEAHMDFGDDERSERFIRNISKWDIRKASPELELSPPVKPLVMWIENTVPKEYRQGVKDGILQWNKAFEQAGIKDAIVVKFQPDDTEWDISDARYNTVHWNVSHSMAYGGVSQWVADPRTGEMIHGGFIIEGDQIRSLLELRRIKEPDRVEQFKNRFKRDIPEDPRNHCHDFSEFLVDQARFGLQTIAARVGIENVSKPLTDELIYQFLVMLSSHEMGHVLGLRHNFEGSTLHRLEDLHNKSLTGEVGLTSSVMDYNPINIAPEGVEQGYYWDPTVGPYDKLAIEYAYKDVKPATGETKQEVLTLLAEKAETPRYTYGTDEDLFAGFSGWGIDPLCNQGDLGNDPLAYGKQVAQLALDTIPKLPNLVKEGEDYTPIRQGFNHFLSAYLDSAYYALKHIGGQYVNRVKKGGPHDPDPLDPVSPAKQREALQYIIETVFDDEIYDFDPELLNKLAAQKWYHWGSRSVGPAHEYSINELVNGFYDVILYNLYSPLTIRRILDAERQRHEQAVNFTLPELFKTVTNGVWDDVLEPDLEKLEDGYFKNEDPLISSPRRMLQRLHLKRMIEIMLEPPISMPEDARTQAWRALRTIRDGLRHLSKHLDKVDDYSRDHINESLEKIERALNARLSVRVDFW